MTKKKTRNKILTIGVFFVLVLFPVLAVYMSSSGLKAYRSLRAELKVYADSVKVNNLDLISHSGEGLDDRALSGRVTVSHFTQFNCVDCSGSWEEMKRVQAEYKRKTTKRILLMSFITDADSVAQLQELIQQHKIDTSNWKLVMTDSSQLNTLYKNYQLNAEKAEKTFTLTDINRFIVNYYDPTQTAEVNNMMKHMAMLLPAKKDRKKIRFQRDKNHYN